MSDRPCMILKLYATRISKLALKQMNKAHEVHEAAAKNVAHTYLIE